MSPLRTLLRHDVPGLVLAVLILTAGLVALAIAIARWKRNDRTLLWFGLFSTIYGLRLFGKLAMFRVYVTGYDDGWDYFVAFGDFIIIVPALLFVQNVYGTGWRSLMRLMAWFLLDYAIVGIALAILMGKPYAIPEPSYIGGPLFLLVLAVGWVAGYRPPSSRDNAVLFSGFGVFLAFVMFDKYSGLSLKVEPIGLFLFICSLGYVAARRFIAGEQELRTVGEELASARRIQMSILPRAKPIATGFEIAFRYVPMTSVAGDFYDFVIVDDQRFGILVADVAGHGVPAALIASMVKIALASQTAHAHDPARVLTELNQIFCKQLNGQYLTAAYLFVDGVSRIVEYSAAGHPPLLLWRGKQLLQREQNGLFLGFLKVAEYSNLSMPIEPGDRFLLYTDGLIEAENQSGHAFGDQRLESVMASHADLPAEQFADAMINDVIRWSPIQSDDLTVLVLDVTG